MTKFKFSLVCVLTCVISLGAISCHNESNAKQQTNSDFTESLNLKKGMEIKVSPLQQDKAENKFTLRRRIAIEKSPSAEGMTFSWNTENTQNPAAGRITLANLLASTRATLPMFWPEGELYLSNSTAIWISDKGFEELKKDHQTHWEPGIIKNPLLGPLEDFKPIASNLSLSEKALSNFPKKLESSMELKTTRKKGLYQIKINGVLREVRTIEVGNWLVSLSVLDNPQNPLILQLHLLATASPAEIAFSPLALVKNYLEYRVDEITLPQM